MRFEDQPQHIQDERYALHRACGQAFFETGSVRTPEWQAASAALRAHENKYGMEYNPD
jgi:hypothetical protein